MEDSFADASEMLSSLPNRPSSQERGLKIEGGSADADHERSSSFDPRFSIFYPLPSTFSFLFEFASRFAVPTVADLVAHLERFAPLELAEEWDNVGLLAGDRARETDALFHSTA